MPTPRLWPLAAVALACACSDSSSGSAPTTPNAGSPPDLATANAEDLSPLDLLALGDQEIRAGNEEKGAELFRRVVELQPDFAPARFALGTTLVPMASAIVLGSSTIDYEILDDAIGHLRRAVELDPDNSNYVYWLGRALDVRGHEDEALEYLDKAIEMAPDFAKAHKRRGLVLAERGDVDDATAAFERARELDPADSGVHLQLGNLVLETDPEKARGLYEQAVELNPTSSSAYHGLSQALMQLGDTEGAEEARELADTYAAQRETLQELVRLANDNPGNVEAQFDAAEMHVLLGNYESAWLMLERVLRLQPDHAKAHYYCGLIVQEEGDYERAKDHMEECLYFAPDMIGPRIELLRVYQELDNPARIAELAGQLEALVEDGSPSVRNATAEVFLEIGREEKALEYLRSVLAEDPENVDAKTLLERAEG